jgi:spermidine synthase
VREHFARLDLQVAFWLTLLIGALACFYSFTFYHEKAGPRWLTALRGWAAKCEFSLEMLGGFSYVRLALASVLGLFLELLMIRWISSEVRVFAYLKNYVLVSCFLGFGLGCYLCRKKINLVALLAPLFSLVFLIKFPWEPLRTLISALPSYLGAASEVHFFGIPNIPFSFLAILGLFAAVAITVPLFILNAMVFVPLGQIVGGYLEMAPRGVSAYSVNILGSLAGILLFTLLSLLSQPPLVWFAIAGLLLFLLLIKLPALRWATVVAFGLCLILVGLRPGGNLRQYWSPYQLLTVVPRVEAGELISYQLDTNHTWFQQVVNLSPAFVSAHPQFYDQVPAEWDAYNVPYHFYSRPTAVLVLGAGMGNDVAAAVRNGAEHVVGVEIDPLIIKLGRELHFEHPYSSPHVTVVNDDARSYVQNSREKFDLIVYSLLDSHTNISHYSAVRIDNYVYTLEAMQAARRLLKDDGLLILKFQVTTPWIAGRLFGLLENVFGRPPLDFYADASSYSTGGRFFVTGSAARLDRALADPALAAFVKAHSDIEMQKARLTTDDWPFFYQHEPGLPLIIIIVSVVLIVLTRLLIRQTGAGGRSIHWHFFFLGAGFLLLESQIISRMALLFGTTWLVNSIVIAVLLVLIVVANLLVEGWPTIPVGFAYAGIFVCILISYLLPLERLFFQSFWVRALVATLALCMPVGFASIVFIRSFAAVRFSGEALGSNLLGGLVGGMLEAVSMWTGIRSLLVLAALLYLASYVARRGLQPQLAPAASPQLTPRTAQT